MLSIITHFRLSPQKMIEREIRDLFIFMMGRRMYYKVAWRFRGRLLYS